MTNRRHRRHPREVSDHAIFALHKYYIRAELMREQYGRLVAELREEYGPTEWMRYRATTKHFNARTYLDYWWAALYAVIEGYERLSLHDNAAESLLRSPNRQKLNRYRAGIYHFREKYFDPDILALAQEDGAAQWVVELDMALGHFLLNEMRRRRERRLADQPS